MNLYNEIAQKKEKISIVGLGYVGMPIAVSFARKADVIGFDINEEKIDQYRRGIDVTREVGDEVISKTSVKFTSDPEKLKEAKFHVVAVPTPINQNHTPDLAPVESASRTVGQNLTKGSIVVFESTVFPGVTEEICLPILEEESGLKAGIDFKVGYSPERINPGDKVNRLETIVKIVSGMDEESLNTIAQVYEMIIEAGVHRAPSIKVAEAAKVIENAQRDVNIAFMNELAMIFDRLNVDTQEVLEAAGTKWNFLKFSPGLVGGHCIGVDPYYLTYKAEQEGYHSKIISAGRRINDSMGHFVVENIIKLLIDSNVLVKEAKIAILGFTFKENTPDCRNTRVIDIVNELKDFGIDPLVVDPVADTVEAENEYNIKFDKFEDLKELDAIILAVGHDQFMKLDQSTIESLYKNDTKKILVDIKGVLDKSEYSKENNFAYWRL
jgi:UDP-N-acetyl-D-galactosamine dehydrogenase